MDLKFKIGDVVVYRADKNSDDKSGYRDLYLITGVVVRHNGLYYILKNRHIERAAWEAEIVHANIGRKRKPSFEKFN